MKYRFKHIVEYSLFRVLTVPLYILPYRAALFLGCGLAWLAFHVFRFRRAEAERRIKQVFGDRFTEQEITRIAWISLRNLFFNAVELVRLPRTNGAWFRKHVLPEDPHVNVRKFMNEGRGVILAVPHMGNWDLAGVGTHRAGLPIFFIARDQKNPLMNAYLNRMRKYMGSDVVMRDDPSLVRKVLRRLKKGELMAILIDLRAKTEALNMQYLGHSAHIGAGMALFARQANAIILGSYVYRIGWTKHCWEVGEPIFANPDVDKQEDWKRMTQEVLNGYDAAVRKHPEQYFWYNKRWVLEPLDDTERADHKRETP